MTAHLSYSGAMTRVAIGAVPTEQLAAAVKAVEAAVPVAHFDERGPHGPIAVGVVQLAGGTAAGIEVPATAESRDIGRAQIALARIPGYMEP